jgi:hypothetical protein
MDTPTMTTFYEHLWSIAESCPPYAIDGHLCDAAGVPKPDVDAATASESTVTERQLCNMIQLDVLGEMENRHVKVFSEFHRKARVIESVGRMGYEDLLQLAGPKVKEFVVRRDDEAKPGAGTFPLSEVKDAIALLAGYRMIGDDTELGVGCWAGKDEDGSIHPSVVLVGAGEAAEFNGKMVLEKITHPRCKGNLLDFESGTTPWYEFDSLAENLRKCDREFAQRTRDDLISLFSKWRWRCEKTSPVTMAGLVFATWVQSLWEWRPQVALIGASKSGKTLCANALSGIFGSLCCKSSQSSAAGIRQAIKNSSRVVLCDEFEHSRQRQEILDMLRASGRGDAVLRGTAHQKARHFALRHIVWVAAIEVNLKHAPDRNRFIVLELLNPLTEMRGKLTLPTQSQLADLGCRSLAVAIRYIHAAKPLASRLKDVRISGIDDRILESYAVPAAILAAIDELDDDHARELMRHMLEGETRESEVNMADESAMMEALLAAHVFIGREKMTVSQAIDLVEANRATVSDEAANSLESVGVKISRYTDGPRDGDKCLVISSRMVPQNLFKGTDWEGKSVTQILQRIHPDAEVRRLRVGGVRAQCVQIPFDFVHEDCVF